MKILWIKAGGLVPPDIGGRIRSYNILRHLARHHSVTLFTFYSAHENDVHERLSGIFHRVIRVPLDLPPAKGVGESFDYVVRLLSRNPYNLTKYCRRQVRTKLAALLREERFDVLVCDFLVAAGVVPWELPCPKVLFTHNVEAVIWQRHFNVAQNPLWKAVSWLEWKRMANAERRYLKKADHVLAVSENDRQAFADFINPNHLTVIPTGADTEFFRPTGVPEEANSLVFTGAMDWLPNEDGMFYFANEILPLIRQEAPGVSLSIVGRNPSQRLLDLASKCDKIQVTGRVEDVRPYMAKGAVYIVPLRIGGGTRLKIFEAMSMAKAVVSTSIGAEGLPVKNDEHLVIADGPAKFAENTLRLLSAPPLRAQIGQAARELVEMNYSWNTVSQAFTDVLENVLKNSDEKYCV
jgi:polysaccharide biosynthesis protein PslH